MFIFSRSQNPVFPEPLAGGDESFLKEGDMVITSEAFKQDSYDAVPLKKGLKGRIVCFNDNGDALVDFLGPPRGHASSAAATLCARCGARSFGAAARAGAGGVLSGSDARQGVPPCGDLPSSCLRWRPPSPCVRRRVAVVMR
eukprot:gene16131-biopygen4150